METNIYIKDRTGKVIGRLSKNTITDRSGKVKGHYDELTDETKDRSGKFFGKGDQRTRLI